MMTGSNEDLTKVCLLTSISPDASNQKFIGKDSLEAEKFNFTINVL